MTLTITPCFDWSEEKGLGDTFFLKAGFERDSTTCKISYFLVILNIQILMLNNNTTK